MNNLLKAVLGSKDISRILSDKHMGTPGCENSLCNLIKITEGMTIYVSTPNFADEDGNWTEATIDRIYSDTSFEATFTFRNKIEKYRFAIEDIGIMWAFWKPTTPVKSHQELWDIYTDERNMKEYFGSANK